MEVAKLVAVYEADVSQFTSATNKANSNLDKTVKSAQSASRSIGVLESNLKGLSGVWNNFKGNFLADSIQTGIGTMKQFTAEGIKLNASFDKLTRYVGTVDNSLKNAQGLNTFRQQFEQLASTLPHTADEFAKASYTITSGLQLFGSNVLKF